MGTKWNFEDALWDALQKWDVVNNRWRDELLVDPQNTEEWCNSLQELKQSAEERRAMIQDMTTFLESRVKSHGDFSVTATFSRALKNTMRDAPNWPSLSPVQKEALDMIEYKIARILSGNPNEPDHWQDIAGYAELAKQDLESTKIPLPIYHGAKPASPFCECEHCEALRTREAKDARKED